MTAASLRVRAAAGMLVVLMVVLTVCTSSGADAPSDGESSQGGSAVASQGRVVGQASCDDPGGDRRAVEGLTPGGLVPGTDLRRVELTADGDSLTVTLTSWDDFPDVLDEAQEESVRWVVWTLEGYRFLHQLRIALDHDGWEVSFESGDDRLLLDVPVMRRGPELEVTFPLEALSNLTPSFGWVALSTQGTNPVQDVCPDAASDSLAPDVQLPFPAR